MVLAGIIAFVFITLYFNVNGNSSRQSVVIDTCIGEISSLNDTISTMNDSLDSIYKNVSNVAGDDYETQADTLYNISLEADGANGTGNSYDTVC